MEGSSRLNKLVGGGVGGQEAKSSIHSLFCPDSDTNITHSKNWASSKEQ